MKQKASFLLLVLGLSCQLISVMVGDAMCLVDSLWQEVKQIYKGHRHLTAGCSLFEGANSERRTVVVNTLLHVSKCQDRESYEMICKFPSDHFRRQNETLFSKP